MSVVASFVGADFHSTAAAAGVVTIPDAAQAGDIAIALLTIKISSGSPGTPTPPSGWALASGPIGNASPSMTAWIYTKTLLTADLGADMAFSRADTNPLNLSLVVYHGEGGTPIDVAPTLVTNGTTPSVSASVASITPADANDVVVGLVAARGGANGPYTFTLPTGYTARELCQSSTAAAQNVSALIFDSNSAIGSTSALGAKTVTASIAVTSVTAFLTISPSSVTTSNFRYAVGGSLVNCAVRYAVGGSLVPIMGGSLTGGGGGGGGAVVNGSFNIDAPVTGTTKGLKQTRTDALVDFPNGLGPHAKYFSGPDGWLKAATLMGDSGYGGLASEISPLLCCQGAHVDSEFNTLMTNMHNALPSRVVTDGVLNSTTTVTSATAAFTAADVGSIVVGTGIPTGAAIETVNSATSVTLTAAATATATGRTLTISQTWWACYQSEPEQASKNITIPGYQSKWKSMATQRNGHANGNQVYFMPVLMSFQQFDVKNPPLPWGDLVGGLDIDGIGWDIYNPNSRPSTWAFDPYHTQIKAAAKTLGVPWALPEMGIELSNDGSDTVAKMAARLQNIVNLCSADPTFLWASYWLEQNRWGTSLLNNTSVMNVWKTAMGY